MDELLTSLGLADYAVELVVSGNRGLTLVVRSEIHRPGRRVVRVHRGSGVNRVAHEHEVLVGLRQRAAPSFARTVLEFLAGTPIVPASDPVAFRGQLEQVRVWLAELWSIEPPVELGEPYTVTGILATLDAEVAALGAPVAAAWRRTRAAAEVCDALPPRYCHFDLSPSNVLISRGGAGVIDWEYARRAQPLYDWCRFVVQMGLAWSSRPPDLSQRLARDEAVLDPVERLFFRPGALADAVASETLAAAALAGVELAGLDGVLKASLLQYLAPQIPWRDRRMLLERVLGGTSVVSTLV
jgi:hypothetical protein